MLADSFTEELFETIIKHKMAAAHDIKARFESAWILRRETAAAKNISEVRHANLMLADISDGNEVFLKSTEIKYHARVAKEKWYKITILRKVILILSGIFELKKNAITARITNKVT